MSGRLTSQDRAAIEARHRPITPNGYEQCYCNHMRRVADALDMLTPARYGEVLRWVADRCDAALAPTEPEASSCT